MMDPIERGEARAMAAYAENTKGVPSGKWRCPGCQQIRDLEDAHPVSADPYSEAGCEACIAQLFPRLGEMKCPSCVDGLVADCEKCEECDGDGVVEAPPKVSAAAWIKPTCPGCIANTSTNHTMGADCARIPF